MKFKERLKDKYYLLMVCSLVVTIFWVCANLNTCYTEFDQMLLIIYAMGFMAIPYVIRHFKLLDKTK